RTAADEHRRRVYTILLLRCEYVGEMKAAEERRRRNADRMIRRLETVFERAAGAGTLNPIWSPKLAALALHGMLVGLFVNWLEGSSKHGFASVAPRCIDTCFAPLRTGDGGTPAESPAPQRETAEAEWRPARRSSRRASLAGV